MSTTVDAILDRISSVCVSQAFGYVAAVNPFSFALEPSGNMAQCFRGEAESGSVIGGFNYTEERTDRIHVWLARAHRGDLVGTYRTLLTDANSIRSAVIRDGVTSGEYFVPADGTEWAPEQSEGQEYAVLRMTVPVNYEAVL